MTVSIFNYQVIQSISGAQEQLQFGMFNAYYS